VRPAVVSGAPVGRVSRSRIGVTGTRSPVAPGPYQPTTSTMARVVPLPVLMAMAPPAPSRTPARLARVVPAGRLRLGVGGGAVPAGHTVRCVSAVGASAVTLTRAAVAPTGAAAPPIATSRG